jgi:hypothetical protein
MSAGREWTLIGEDGRPHRSAAPGTFGGYRPRRIYGRLDCPSALRALATGGYAPSRVFFLDERTAVAAGYRPCGACLRERYAYWKANPEEFRAAVLRGDVDEVAAGT